MRDLYADIDHILISDENSCKQRTAELAAAITETYKDEEDLLFICVLKGGYMFLSDLSKAMTRPHEIDFHGYLQLRLWHGEQRRGANHHGLEAAHCGAECAYR